MFSWQTFKNDSDSIRAWLWNMVQLPRGRGSYPQFLARRQSATWKQNQKNLEDIVLKQD